MGVDAGGDADVGVAEEFLDDDEVDALFQEQGVGRVAEVAETDLPESCLVEEAAEAAGQVAGVERPARRGGEDESVVPGSARQLRRYHPRPPIRAGQAPGWWARTGDPRRCRLQGLGAQTGGRVVTPPHRTFKKNAPDRYEEMHERQRKAHSSRRIRVASTASPI